MKGNIFNVKSLSQTEVYLRVFVKPYFQFQLLFYLYLVKDTVICLLKLIIKYLNTQLHYIKKFQFNSINKIR